MYKKIENYFKHHAFYNAVVHVLMGMGFGILITYPLVGAHPLRWGASIFTLGILGHLYPLIVKK